jgi:hypothetical protein
VRHLSQVLADVERLVPVNKTAGIIPWWAKIPVRSAVCEIRETAEPLEDAARTDMTGTRKTLLLTGAAQAIGGGLLWHLRPDASGVARVVTSSAAGVLWLLASAFVLSALVAPALAARLHAAWMKVARAIGIGFTFAIFTVLFAVLLPLFLFVRLKDPLRKRLGAGSYWEHRSQDDDSLDRALRPY